MRAPHSHSAGPLIPFTHLLMTVALLGLYPSSASPCPSYAYPSAHISAYLMHTATCRRHELCASLVGSSVGWQAVCFPGMPVAHLTAQQLPVHLWCCVVWSSQFPTANPEHTQPQGLAKHVNPSRKLSSPPFWLSRACISVKDGFMLLYIQNHLKGMSGEEDKAGLGGLGDRSSASRW